MDYAKFRSSVIIRRPLPNAVIYDLSKHYETTITLPSGSNWTSELHWHEDHTEYLRLIRGSIRVQLGTRSFTVPAPKPGEPDAIIKVDRYVRHEWSRADRGASHPDEEEVVVVESTDPRDEAKHIFFWNVNGTILEAQATGAALDAGALRPLRERLLDLWVTLRLFAVFATLDNYPVLIDLKARPWSFIPSFARSATESLVSHIILDLAVLIARLFAVQAVDERFTPVKLLQRWKAAAPERRKKR